MRIPVFLSLALSVGVVLAQTPGEPVDGGAPPPLPEEEDFAEPEVRIIQRGGETVREYRIQGKLVAIQVFPKKGPPYFLVDADGDGELETRRNELDPDFLLPGWVIKRW
ncbi:MAG: hypothetical protein Kow006_14190 [Gammaproteobacteria bacterium]